MSYEVSQSWVDVLNERARQQDGEGRTAERDDAHVKGELAAAATCYATHAVVSARLRAQGFSAERIEALSADAATPRAWPFAADWWKPGSPRRDLVKAAALLLAEIERLDRAGART